MVQKDQGCRIVRLPFRELFEPQTPLPCYWSARHGRAAPTALKQTTRFDALRKYLQHSISSAVFAKCWVREYVFTGIFPQTKCFRVTTTGQLCKASEEVVCESITFFIEPCLRLFVQQD